MSDNDRDYSRENSAALSRKQRELDKAEQMAEASKELLSKFLTDQKNRKQEVLAREMLHGYKNGAYSESMERIRKGENPNTVLNETPTGFEELPWNDED